MEVRQVGLVLVAVGVLLAVIGILMSLGGSLPASWRPGNLPGDLTFRRGGSSITLLLGTSIVLSLLLSLIVALIRR